MIRRRRDPFKLLRLRRIVQIVFLLLLIALLAMVTTRTVSRSGRPLLVVALTTTVLTLVLGRVWCGWVCPVNTVLDRVHFKGAIERGARLSERWRTVKYVLLFLVVAAALLSLLLPSTDQTLSPGLPPNQRPLVGVGIGILALAAIVGLDAVAKHFWCRYLCPLGGAVALISKIAPMRRIVRVHCNDCSVCVDACPLGAIDPRRGFANDPGECTVCFDCLTSCTSSSNGFTFSRPELLNRRRSTVGSEIGDRR